MLILCAMLLGGGLYALPLPAFQANAAAAAPRLVLQSGAGWVTGLAFSHDGRRLVSLQGAELGTHDLIRTWDVASSSELVRMLRSKASSAVHSDVRFSFDDQFVLTSDGSSVVLWDSRTGQPSARFQAPSALIRRVAIAPGTRLVGAEGDFGCVLWQPDRATNPETPIATGPHCQGQFFTASGQLFTISGTEISTPDSTTATAERRVQAPHLITQAAFSLDGSVVAVASAVNDDPKGVWGEAAPDQLQRVWVYRTDTGRLIRELATGDEAVTVALSDDGKSLAVGGRDAVRVWMGSWDSPLRVGVETDPHVHGVRAIAFSPDGRSLAIGSYNGVSIVDVMSGREVGALQGDTGTMTALAVAPDGSIITGSLFGNMFVWDTTTGRRLPRRPIHQSATSAAPVTSLAVSATGTQVLSGGSDGVARLWNLTTGTPVASFGKPGASSVIKAERSRDEQWVLTLTNGLWRWSSSGKLLGEVNSPSPCIADFSVSPTTDEFATLSCYPGPIVSTPGAHGVNVRSRKYGLATLQVRNISTGQVTRQITLDSSSPRTLAYTPSGTSLVVFGTTIQVYDTSTLQRSFEVSARNDVSTGELGRSILYIDYFFDPWEPPATRVAPAFSLHGDRLAIATQPIPLNPQQIVLLDTRAIPWRVAGRFDAPSEVVALTLSPDGRFLVTSGADGMTRVWDVSNPTAAEMRAVLASVDSETGNGWAVSDPAGRYDASDPDHLEGLHWVRGDEVIDLGQLKSRFYTPGLLAKIWRGDRLPDVGGAIGALAARPDVTVATPSPGASTVQVTLTNQGGGLGPIHLIVNGRPLEAECRPTNPQAPREIVTCPLTGAVFRSDGHNEIEVTVENAVDHVPTRPRGVALTTAPRTSAAAPGFYGLVVGTSRFSGPADMNLQFAARDATSFEAALRIGATRLVGADHVHLTTLTSDAADEAHQPTKANIARAFREIAAKAQPEDIVLVYFAGHGLAYGKDMYLLPDAGCDQRRPERRCRAQRADCEQRGTSAVAESGRRARAEGSRDSGYLRGRRGPRRPGARRGEA